MQQTPSVQLTAVERNSISILDESNPRALINIVSDKFADRLRSTPQEYLVMTEDELYMQIFAADDSRHGLLNRLRIAFWLEYDRAQLKNQKMNMSAVYGAVCSEQVFQRITQDRDHVAWIVTPPADYAIAMQELLMSGIEELRKVLRANVVLPNGRIDTRLADVKAKIVQYIDQRVRGAIVQKIDQRNLNATVDLGTVPAPAVTMAGLDEEIKKLHAELGQSAQIPPGETHEVIEAHVVEPDKF